MKHIRKLLCCLVGLGTLSALCFAAPELSGVLKSGGNTYVALRNEASAVSAWYQVGGQFGKFRIMSYDDSREVVILSDGGASIELRLKGAGVEGAPTFALVEQLARGGDRELQTILHEAKALEARRAKTAAELADAESRASTNGSVSNSVTHLRRQLKIEDDNLAYWLRQVVKSQPPQAKP